jgi:mono/diheme cytochrome c family protein
MKTAFRFVALALALTAHPLAAQEHSDVWEISRLDLSKLPPLSDRTDVTFDKDILPLFQTSCVRCHGAGRPRGGLRLDSLAATLKGGRDGKMVIPGDSKHSLLVAAAAQIDMKTTMPPKRRPRPGLATPEGQPSTSTNAAPSKPGGPAEPATMQRSPARPLSPTQVGLVRAWIDQGAK